MNGAAADVVPARVRDAIRLVLVVLVASGLSCKSARKHRPAASEEGLTGGTLVFEDDFERSNLGERWLNRSGRWRIRDGHLTVQKDRNEGVWLAEPLPERVRIEFEARALDEEGDLKCEVFASEPRHQAGYIVILGGWRNTVSVIARLDEHGEDRMESADQARPGVWHRFVLVRVSDTLRWYLDGRLVLQFHDEDPLRGRLFGFNDWNSPVEFDNLKIYEL